MTADDIGKILDELGQKLGPAGQYVFGLAVRQVYIDGIVAIVVAIAVTALGLIVGPRLYRWIADDPNSFSDRGLVGMFAGIGYAFLVGSALVLVVAAVPSMANPEYAAIRDILSHLSK